MVVRQQTFRQLLSARRNNRYPHWVGKADEEVSAAAYRLQQHTFLRVGVTPKFKITRSARVLTIGSCFARNIESKLADAGLSLASDNFALPTDAYLKSVHPKSALNKYNTHSIESEFIVAIEKRDEPNAGLIQIDDDRWWDPLSTHTRADHFDRVAEIRRRISAVTQNVAECDAVIMTLGLNEVWTDQQTGIHFNVMPPPALVRKFGDRFSIIIADLDDNVNSIERSLKIIRAAGPHINVIMTVSPVPMGATLTAMDVIVANTLSKSMLRVAAQVVADRHDFVDYFPSYEMVMNSPPSLAWESDRVHVNPAAIDFVTNYFVEQYIVD